MVDVSVVLPVHNGAETIARQLEAVLSQASEFSFELIVVDNDSNDTTADIVDSVVRSDERVRRVLAPLRHNLSYVRNVGVRECSAPSILFCDDDDLVAPGWLDAMASELTRNEFVASRLEYDLLNPERIMEGRSRFQSQHLDRMFGYWVAAGAGFGVRRSVWDALGGNDEAFNVAGEDYDFVIRAQRELGVVPVLVSGAVVHYRQRADFRSTFRQARRYGRSHVALYRRYAETRSTRQELTSALRDWWWILSRMPFLYRSRSQIRWARRAGMRFGRLSGCLRERTLYP